MGLAGKRGLIASILGLVVVVVVLAIIAPKEQTLGNYIKPVYVHAAVTWVGLMLFAAAGISGLLFLLNKNPRFGGYSYRTQIIALWFWLGSVILGAINMRLIWGGILWAEPKFLAALLILGFAAVGWLITGLTKQKWISSATNVLIGLAVFVLLSFSGRIFHPGNAILNSPSIAIKVYAGLITLGILGIAIQSLRLVIPSEE